MIKDTRHFEHALSNVKWKVWTKTKSFELGHLGFQILRRRASRCPYCCHPPINRPRGSNWGIWAFKSCDGDHQDAPTAAILRSTDLGVRWRTCLPCMEQIWTTGSLQEVKNKKSRRTAPKPKRIAAYVTSIINLDTASFHLNMIGDVTEDKPMGGLQHHLKWAPTIESPSKSILTSPATCPLGHRHLA
ncbi:hypothetical protein NC652_000968 [Populus alba x Populus x berolinensis]|nr:hypothetical protein NC652_000968 [Populus alba x Populus x berolinensis]